MAKDPDLMAQDEDLQVLRAVVRASAGEDSGEGSDHEGEEEQHPRILGAHWSERHRLEREARPEAG